MLQQKSPFQQNPSTIVADYDSILRSALKKAFPSCSKLFGCFAFKVRLLHNESKLIKCAVLGYKTAGLTKQINFFMAYFMIISMLDLNTLLEKWDDLKRKIDEEAFKKVIHLVESEFLSKSGRFHSEATFEHLKNDPVFRLATPAIEGYHYRFKQLMKTYSVSQVETMVEKVIVAEEKHFSSKVVEVNLNRISKPDLPEKYFFDRSMGTLPISTAVADVYGLIDSYDFTELSEKLINAGELNSLPQRKSLTCLAHFEDYKSSLISKEVINDEIIRNYVERRKRMRKDKLESSVPS